MKKKIEDSVRRAEVLASTELVIEEARRYKQEELIRDCNLWDDPAKSSEILAKLADSTKMVDYLKDLAFKVIYYADRFSIRNLQNISIFYLQPNIKAFDQVQIIPYAASNIQSSSAHVFLRRVVRFGFLTGHFSHLQAEEAKLIAQLAEKDAINYGLFKRAYKASLDANKTMDTYEMSKLLKGPYDKEGACLIIEAGSEGYSEV